MRWRALLPTALTTTVATAVLGAVSGIVMPRMIGSNESQYGPIGVVLAVEGWLVVVGGALVVCAALGAVLVKMDTPLGRLSRGSTDPEAWRRPRRRPRRQRHPPTAAFPVTGG